MKNCPKSLVLAGAIAASGLALTGCDTMVVYEPIPPRPVVVVEPFWYPYRPGVVIIEDHRWGYPPHHMEYHNPHYEFRGNPHYSVPTPPQRPMPAPFPRGMPQNHGPGRH